MYWVNIPKKVYFKAGSTSVALKELSQVYRFKKALIVSDAELTKNGLVEKLEALISAQDIRTAKFFSIDEVPSFENIRSAHTKITQFEPDVIIGLGGNAVMSAAKMLWVLDENPDIDFNELAEKFDKADSDISKFPVEGNKAKLVLVPTTVGSGAECSPYAILKDCEGKKRVIASFKLLPEMAVVDSDFAKELSADLIKESAINALSNAIRAFIAPTSSDYVEGWSSDAVKVIIANLPKVLELGPKNAPEALQNLANAAALSGMAIGNAVDTIEADAQAYPTSKEKRPNKGTSERLERLARLVGLDNIDALNAEIEKLQQL